MYSCIEVPKGYQSFYMEEMGLIYLQKALEALRKQAESYGAKFRYNTKADPIGNN